MVLNTSLYKIYAYISMQQVQNQNGKTKIFKVINNNSGDLLGIIKWNSSWRSYCFYPESIILSSSCMKDITDFIDQEMELRKTK